MLSGKTQKSIKSSPKSRKIGLRGLFFSKVSPLNRKDLVLVVIFAAALDGLAPDNFRRLLLSPVHVPLPFRGVFAAEYLRMGQTDADAA